MSDYEPSGPDVTPEIVPPPKPGAVPYSPPWNGGYAPKGAVVDCNVKSLDNGKPNADMFTKRKERQPIIYLACPYTHADALVRLMRFESVSEAAGILMERGYTVFSPVSHSHTIAHIGLENHRVCDLDFWLRQDFPFIEFSDMFVILKLPGWEASRGVKAELAEAQRLGKPVHYIEPDAARFHVFQ
jgi:hypothetical protein